MRYGSLALMAAVAVSAAACGSDPVVMESKGKELQDLQGAYQSRAITAEEYKDQKEEVLDK